MGGAHIVSLDYSQFLCKLCVILRMGRQNLMNLVELEPCCFILKTVQLVPNPMLYDISPGA